MSKRYDAINEYIESTEELRREFPELTDLMTRVIDARIALSETKQGEVTLESDSYWKDKAEALEVRAKEDRRTQHLLVAMVLGVIIYGLLELGFGAGVIGLSVSTVYYVVTTKLTKEDS